MRNFGHDGPEQFNGVGINGKNSEFHAAMGLAVLPYVESILEQRKKQSLYYDEVLNCLEADRLTITEGCAFNYAYYPIIFPTEEAAIKAKEALEAQRISPRRYFYPSLSKLDYVEPQDTPVADDVVRRILCLPLYHELSKEEQDLIARILIRTQRYE